MDWNLFWTAFGAIGGTIGAIATFVAVIVAMWQTKFNYRKKVKLSFSDNITIVPDTASNFYHYVGVSVANIGNRDVVIKNWGFELDNGSQMIIVPDVSPLGRVLQVELPYRLQVEEEVSLYYEKSLFHNALDNCISKGELKGNKKVKFYVSDSTSKKHYVKTDKVASELLSTTKSIDSK